MVVNVKSVMHSMSWKNLAKEYHAQVLALIVVVVVSPFPPPSPYLVSPPFFSLFFFHFILVVPLLFSIKFTSLYLLFSGLCL